MRMREPTRKTKPSRLDDVARLAGVGIATVDRVLNERGGVKPETARKVILAAQQLHLARRLPNPYRRSLRIAVIFPPPVTQFFRRVNEAVLQIASTLDREVTLHRIFADPDSPTDVAAQFQNSTADAFVLYASEMPKTVEAVRRASDSGRPVVTFVNDMPDSGRLAHTGIDNHAAGRTAGYFAARMTSEPGSVVVLYRGPEYRVHQQRLRGFETALAQHAPRLAVSALIEGPIERAHILHTFGRYLIEKGPPLIVYSTGGGSGELGSELAKSNCVGKTLFIGHELTDQSRDLLARGIMTLAIDQNPELQLRVAIDTILGELGYIGSIPASTIVPFTVFSPENVGSALSG
ncbi:LacI family DNA-binding transcriptional regulator [Shinella sp.]|nr:LacI family DNA-binding transcriptional regulator [Shinella sp.]MCO5139078.1 LacI family DNA-binding transcriptional regulator [Shinella sp.]CAK7257459.1 LacI family DNA-binding transcriptional regulator [Shinella sp. WSC3-e]